MTRRTLTVTVERDDGAALRRLTKGFRRAWKTGRYQGEYRSYASPAALFHVLTPVRWALLEQLQGIGPSSLRGLARALGRDVRAVHRDVHALLLEGLIEKDEAGRVHVPFTRIHMEFDVKPARGEAA